MVTLDQTTHLNFTPTMNINKLAKLGDAIAISNLKLSMTDPPTDRGRC